MRVVTEEVTVTQKEKVNGVTDMYEVRRDEGDNKGRDGNNRDAGDGNGRGETTR